jgi:predicted CopG family antitoxin
MKKSFGKTFKSSFKEEDIEKFAQHEGDIPVVPVRVTELSDEELSSNVKESSNKKNIRSLISPSSVGMSISAF